MIVYKWVYKKYNKYYSLMNFGYARMDKTLIAKQPPYEIGKTYINYKRESNRLKRQCLRLYGRLSRYIEKGAGFYFWVEKRLIFRGQKSTLLKLGADINAILECYVDKNDILPHCRDNAIKAKKFKVLKEIKYEEVDNYW